MNPDFSTLLYKELLRFWKVSVQTIAAPVLTALLYLLIFAHALRATSRCIPAWRTRRSSSRARDDGGAAERVREQLVEPDPVEDHRQHRLRAADPASHCEIFLAYMLAAMVRGLVVGAGVLAVTVWFVDLPVAHPLWVCLRAARAAAFSARWAIIAGIWADKFDQLAAFQNFIIMPLTFLVGRVLLDAFAAAVLAGGLAPESVLLHGRRLSLRILRRRRRLALVSLAIVASCLLLLSALCLELLRTGYKLRH